MTRSRAGGLPSRDQREQARREKPTPPTVLSRLSVGFPADQMAALRVLAAKTGQSETSLVREAVRRLVGLNHEDAQRRPKPHPRTGESR